MTSMTRYPQELREWAVRLVLEHGGEYLSEWAAIESISAKLRMTKETLRRWVRWAQVDGGLRSGVTPPWNGRGSGSWSGRTVSCGGPTRWRSQPVSATTSDNFSDGVI